ncbi:MAG: type I restriction-modification system subunit M [Candidatus Enterosoma sp.]|nr:type I restriction-modification system subunit M [Candidatus Enterosoma sp.]
MNKQELAARIWESANNMRSKIEANEYKDYILGFIFYKFLSDKEENTLKKEGWDDESLKEYLVEDDIKDHQDLLKYCKKNYGYFISYDNLFSTWLNKGSDFDVSDVSVALSSFTRHINENHKKVFDKIFETLETGLSKLGDNSGAQTKAIRSLIQLIDPIPMDDKQGYDVLGFIYEYLISNFAANAGKKAGEFYTPHEVSLVMSEIVANHLKDRESIQIYDPTSGSGSLLINIGQSVSKYLKDKNKIKYFAQELKENTYSLTRMNLVMRGIKPENIVARCGDTLADDWPYFEEGKFSETYEALYVDAVVSNPPYSQKWEQHEDSRFADYGIAPKAKADYAFLLHDLYHLQPDGIMTIVLPHGVLFRGGEEGNIRKNLIENDNIDTIIGLPANIFFGTGIPTIIMVLKKKRERNDVLIVDASKGFIKVGKNNKLRASDIKKIVDTVIKRETVDKYSRVVSKEEIRNNDYNLNIPRYVDSSEKAESFDIYALMFGGIPNNELNEYKMYWDAFPSLKNELFESINRDFSLSKVEDIKQTILENLDVKKFINDFNNAFADFDSYLEKELIQNYESINISKEESVIADNIFERIIQFKLLDKYSAYQLLDDDWSKVAVDLEIIKTEGFESSKKVDPNMVSKKKDGKDVEVQEGWIGRVIPFELIQKEKFSDELNKLNACEHRLEEIASLYNETLEELSEDEKEEYHDILTDEKDAFVNSEVVKQAKKFKGQKFSNESLEYKIITIAKAIDEEKELKKNLKTLQSNLEASSKKVIESLTDDEVFELLKKKWINPLLDSLSKLPQTLINDLAAKLQKLSKKYETTYLDLDTEIRKTEESLASMIDDLEADEFDKKGLLELQKLLRGE